MNEQNDDGMSAMVPIESTQLKAEKPAKAFKKLCSLYECIEIAYEAISHEYICNRCGLVLDTDSLDRGNEWKSFIVDKVSPMNRVGPPILGKFMENTSTRF